MGIFPVLPQLEWNGERNEFTIEELRRLERIFPQVRAIDCVCFLFSDVCEKALFEMSEQGFFAWVLNLGTMKSVRSKKDSGMSFRHHLRQRVH